MEETNVGQHELSWLLTDALGLFHFGRKYSAMILLLCAVDALARQADPDNDKVSERFEEFLKTQMRRPGRPQVWNIYVPKRDEILSFEYILYKYLRNPVVHEGARLELDHPSHYAVCLDWSNYPRGIQVDSDHKRVVLGGDLVLDILIDAVANGLKDALENRVRAIPSESSSDKHS
jgi:hypothetical protein